jgi:hypothetical protein
MTTSYPDTVGNWFCSACRHPLAVPQAVRPRRCCPEHGEQEYVFVPGPRYLYHPPGKVGNWTREEVYLAAVAQEFQGEFTDMMLAREARKPVEVVTDFLDRLSAEGEKPEWLARRQQKRIWRFRLSARYGFSGLKDAKVREAAGPESREKNNWYDIVSGERTLEFAFAEREAMERAMARMHALGWVKLDGEGAVEKS